MAGRSTYRAVVLGLVAIGLAACATSPEQVDGTESIVLLDHPRFADAASDFRIFRDNFTGQAGHSAAYQTEDGIARLMVLVAGTTEYIGKIDGEQDVIQWCESTFFRPPKDENATPIDLPSWRDGDTVETTFGQFQYRKFSVAGSGCTCFLHGWGNKGNAAANGNSMLLVGYVCNASKDLAGTEIESLIKAINFPRR